MSAIAVSKHNLPSIQVREAYKCFLAKGSIPKLTFEVAQQSVRLHRFLREDIIEWLKQTGYKKSSYFTQDLPEGNDAEEQPSAFENFMRAQGRRS